MSLPKVSGNEATNQPREAGRAKSAMEEYWEESIKAELSVRPKAAFRFSQYAEKLLQFGYLIAVNLRARLSLLRAHLKALF